MAKLYDYVLKNPKITSGYGPRTHPITGEKNKMHYGTDLNSSDKNIYAIEEGYVQKVVTGQDKATTGFGNYIWVRYPRIDLSLIHAHCSKVLLKKGDKVKKGDVIAIMGSTGASTAVHLHLGMTRIGSDTWLNPETYDYKPAEVKVEDTTTNNFEAIIETLNKQIESLEAEISKLNEDIQDMQKEIDNEKLCKYSYSVENNGRYSIDLNIGEVLIVK